MGFLGVNFMNKNLTLFQRQWVEISERFGLEIQLSYAVELGDRKLSMPVRLLGFGAEKGMLLVTDYDLIRDVTEQLVNCGYGYSCLAEPLSAPLSWEYVEEMLKDWGPAS